MAAGSSNPPNIIFPIQGSVNLGQAPSTPLTGSLYIVLYLASGGGCQLAATNNATGSLANLISVSNNVASWNFPPTNFPNQNCMQTTAQGNLMNYSFQLYMLTNTGTVGATFTSDSSQFNLPNTFPVPQMNVLIGCLPAGVRIRMADGSERAVETFTGTGETVRSPDLDAPAVTATMWGSEDHPMVAIRDALGHRLTLTEAHPVLTTRGPVMASKLKVGDVVLTESGNAALVSVERLAHQEPIPIYNLTIGTEKQAADGRTTFYADGILVGDQQMQQDLATKQATPRALSQMEILRALPVAWHQDYVNSLRHD
jgi:Intein/homing endonuclease